MAERVTLDWARLDHDGDLPVEHEPRWAVEAPERDWDGINARLRDGLGRLWAEPMVRNDAQCQAIMRGLLAERGGDALVSAVTRIELRVDALLAARRQPPPPRSADILPKAPARPISLLGTLFKR